MKTRVINGKKPSKCLAEKMMEEFHAHRRISEGLVQGEFDFDSKPDRYNPDDTANDVTDMKSSDYDSEAEEREWFPVYDAIDAAAKKFPSIKHCKCGELKEQNAFTVCFDDNGNLCVAVRYSMFDPLDGDFYDMHNQMLTKIAKTLPAGFTFDFADCDDSGNSRQYIGSKCIMGKKRDTESDATGVEETLRYDVIETLIITKDEALSEGEYNPDDATNDLNDARSSDYEDQISNSEDSIECDFPAWALDYVVNAELGSLSRLEKQSVDKWIEMMDREGYDMNLASYGEEEYFSNSPEFGLPCDCVTATIPKKHKLNESTDDAIKSIWITKAEFDDCSREMYGHVSDEDIRQGLEEDKEKAEEFKFPIYLDITVPDKIAFAQFEDVRDQIEEIGIKKFNEEYGFMFYKAVSLEFEDATYDMLVENEFDPVTKYLNF